MSAELQESISAHALKDESEQTVTIITPPALEKHGEEILKDIESKTLSGRKLMALWVNCHTRFL